MARVEDVNMPKRRPFVGDRLLTVGEVAATMRVSKSTGGSGASGPECAAQSALHSSAVLASTRRGSAIRLLLPCAMVSTPVLI